MTEKELSEEHIEKITHELYQKLHNLPRKENRIFRLEEVLKNFINRDLTLIDIKEVKNVIEKLISNNENHETYFKYEQYRTSISRFIEELKPYFVSDAMRKEIEKGANFHTPAKIHKYEKYIQHEALRSLACENYRKIIMENSIFRI